MNETETAGAATLPRRKLVGCDGKPGEGPFMLMVLEVESDRIFDAKYQTYGCPAAHACGQFATEWALGKTLDQARHFSAQDVLNGVGRMPLGREHCPGLTVRALCQCLDSA